MALKKYKITFSHILDVRNGQPRFCFSAVTLVGLSRFTVSIQFFKHHSSKTNKILSIVEVK